MPGISEEERARRDALIADAQRTGRFMKDVAGELGISERSLRRYREAKGDPAIEEAKTAVNTQLEPALVWAKTKSEDGTSFSVLLKPQVYSESTLEKIRDVFEGIVPADPVAPPSYVDEDLMSVYPIADAHVGMLAWGKETGEDFDTTKAANRIKEWIGRAVSSSPPSKRALIIDVGDLTHADDQTNQTPASKHNLDVDTRHYRTLEATITALVSATYSALERHAEVMVSILPGNHNPTSYMAVLFALSEHFRMNDRVTVFKQPGQFFVYEFGKCLIAAHHGHGGKPERMVMFIADEHAEMWGRTKHRFLWTGHLHHMKAADIGGVQWEQLRALTARDAYAVSNAYVARSQLQAVTLHREFGEVQRVKVSSP